MMLLFFTLTLCCVPLLASELTFQIAQRAVRDWRAGELAETAIIGVALSGAPTAALPLNAGKEMFNQS